MARRVIRRDFVTLEHRLNGTLYAKYRTRRSPSLEPLCSHPARRFAFCRVWLSPGEIPAQSARAGERGPGWHHGRGNTWLVSLYPCVHFWLGCFTLRHQEASVARRSQRNWDHLSPCRHASRSGRTNSSTPSRVRERSPGRRPVRQCCRGNTPVGEHSTATVGSSRKRWRKEP